MAFIPSFWRFFLIDTSTLNTAGYKVAAYINLFTWSPYAGAILLFWMSGSNDFFVDMLVSTMKFSIAGPWFLNFFAIYVIFATGLTTLNGLTIGASVGYVFYSFVTMAM